MAEICLAYGYTPAEYRAMTLAEIKEFKWLLQQIKKEQGK